MEKGEIAHSEQFNLFPQCFPKAFFFNVLKLVYMEERVKSIKYLLTCYPEIASSGSGITEIHICLGFALVLVLIMYCFRFIIIGRYFVKAF